MSEPPIFDENELNIQVRIPTNLYNLSSLFSEIFNLRLDESKKQGDIKSSLKSYYDSQS
jgi:hypothetical protein